MIDMIQYSTGGDLAQSTSFQPLNEVLVMMQMKVVLEH
jgi:hypothetical protein